MNSAELSKEIEEKITGLSDVARREALDFIEFLAAKEAIAQQKSGGDEADFWNLIGGSALARIWDNEEDDVYAKLLES